MATTQRQQQQQEGVIDPFTNEGGEGYLRDRGRRGVLAYSGEITAEGKAEGRGTIRCKAGWTIRGAEFCNGAMLPCRAVFASEDGDAFAGPLAASGAVRGRRARRGRARGGRRVDRGDVARQRRGQRVTLSAARRRV
jgi:hypothetical protein